MAINIETLKEFLGSDEEFIATLMDKFIQEMPREEARMKAFASQRDWKGVRAVAHKMLSSTKIFGLYELTSVLQDVERFAESQTNLELMPDLLSKFENSCKSIVEEMKLQREKLQKK